MDSFTKYRVVVELKRIQSYLFCVPKLKTILGANALVGEALRVTLPSLADNTSSMQFPDDVPLTSIDSDPLQHRSDQWEKDDPKNHYSLGVLTRDGGHLQVLFDADCHAKDYASEVRNRLELDLPGIMYEIRVEAWHDGKTGSALHKAWTPLELGSRVGTVALPFAAASDLKVCELSGQDAATRTIDVGKTVFSVSPRVEAQWNAGVRFGKKETRDIVGLFQQMDGVLPCTGSNWVAPNDLETLAGGPGKYLAVIHVDGNNVGSRTPIAEHLKGDDESADAAFGRWLRSEATVEAFFYSMRASVRAALVESLKKTFVDSDAGGVSPYQLLMVGGDDVLLLMRAESAFKWLVNYAESLRAYPLSDGKPLDVGAGIVFAKPDHPFHALHALAEELASSAKRLSRVADNVGRSVVDWLVLSESASLGVAKHRVRHDMVRYLVNGNQETLIGTAKPYFILPDEKEGEESGTEDKTRYSLKGLLTYSQKLSSNEDKTARSQRKNLPAALMQGRLSGEAAVNDLPTKLWCLIKGFQPDTGASPWRKLETCNEEGRSVSTYLTQLIDLVEVCEIPMLGAQSPSPAQEATLGVDSDGE